MNKFRQKALGWDWLTIIVVSALLLMGIINIYSAAYNPDRPFLFDIKTLYGKQIMWIGIGLFLGIVISDRKSTRLNSSHVRISYAVFCLKKKKNKKITYDN